MNLQPEAGFLDQTVLQQKIDREASCKKEERGASYCSPVARQTMDADEDPAALSGGAAGGLAASGARRLGSTRKRDQPDRVNSGGSIATGTGPKLNISSLLTKTKVLFQTY